VGALPTSWHEETDLIVTTAVDELWGLVAPYLEAERLELDDLEVLGRGAGTTVRVVVDGADGVDVERLAAVSGGISRLLDGPVGPAGPYRLEVTSPGLERRLRRPRHFEKAIGREVVVKLPGESVRGILVAAGEHDFTVEAGGERRVVRYDQAPSVRTVFTVPTKPKPGKR
jgi:ribosome maturation factor RimP